MSEHIIAICVFVWLLSDHRLVWRLMRAVSVWPALWASCRFTCWSTEPSTASSYVKRGRTTGLRLSQNRSEFRAFLFKCDNIYDSKVWFPAKICQNSQTKTFGCKILITFLWCFWYWMIYCVTFSDETLTIQCYWKFCFIPHLVSHSLLARERHQAAKDQSRRLFIASSHYRLHTTRKLPAAASGQLCK